MTFAFLSYSRKDKDFTLRLKSDLENNGIEIWWDRDGIPAGKNWDDEIAAILRSGKVTHFLLVASTTSIASGNVLDEITLALDNRIEYVIPLIMETCQLPLRVCRRNWIDFTDNYAEAFQKLLQQLATVSGPSRTIAPPLVVVTPVKQPTAQQVDAAHENTMQTRLIAGPGTGKSFVIEERVSWLLLNRILAKSICVVSFTRASTYDLSKRIAEYCEGKQQTEASEVRVTTLHSLALRTLRKAKLLQGFSVNPLVLDKWELENIFDAEMSEETGTTPARCEEIRRAYEAYWSTGDWNPANYIQPEQPVSPEEKQLFERFHGPTTLTYCCVLPGEIIRKCLEYIDSGTLEPVSLLGISHLIVDEFQDLNDADLAFVRSFTDGGVSTFVAGDDDQSIYSFRFASPAGIQNFIQQYPNTAQHELARCFRCTPAILTTAQSLIARHSSPRRIPKTINSQYETTVPPVSGLVHRWIFRSGVAEAKAIVDSCKALIQEGLNPREILILISSRGALLPTLTKAFEEGSVGVELPTGVSYISTNPGRFAYAILRIACDLNLEDYVAHRLILGLPSGIGIGTCNAIRKLVIDNNLNYLNLFYQPLPANIFKGRTLTAINRARTLCEQLRSWKAEDTLISHSEEIAQLVGAAFNQAAAQVWKDTTAHLPADINLKELQTYLSADTDEQQAKVLESVYQRLELEPPQSGFLPPNVRIMTMHGVKGLDAQVVFIPALEAEILPNPKHRPYPGLVLEAARLLYVSITRARAACVMSYATNRFANGRFEQRTPCSFLPSLQGRFDFRDGGLTAEETSSISQMIEIICELN